jgi:hypothetical protein
MSAVIAGTPPRYGTCTASMPAMCMNNWPKMCVLMPMPLEAMLILPGLALP